MLIGWLVCDIFIFNSIKKFTILFHKEVLSKGNKIDGLLKKKYSGINHKNDSSSRFQEIYEWQKLMRDGRNVGQRSITISSSSFCNNKKKN